MEEKTTFTPTNTQPPETPHEPQKLNPKKKKLLLLGAVLLGLIALVGIIALLTKDKDSARTSESEPQQYTQSPQSNESNDAFTRDYLRGCKDRKVSFRSAPLPLDQLGYIEPMGKTSDGHVTPTDHVYVAPINNQVADNSYDVIMPADGTVIAIGAMPAQYIGDRDQQTAAEDHRIAIAHNCQFASIFIHVHQLSDTLRKAIGGTLEPNTTKYVSIELKAGDKIGKIGGNPVDWSLMDAKKKLSGFITPDLYKSEPWKIHVIDPMSVYSGSLKQELTARSLRNSEPYGGKIDYDVKGALVGNWFREGTNGYAGADQSRYWDGHLSIAPNYIDPQATTVSLGNWQGKAAQFTAKSGSKDPSKVTKADGAVAYELVDMGFVTPNGQRWNMGLAKGISATQTGPVRGTVLVQVLDGEKLKVELFPNKTATGATAFTANAQTYAR